MYRVKKIRNEILSSRASGNQKSLYFTELQEMQTLTTDRGKLCLIPED